MQTCQSMTVEQEHHRSGVNEVTDWGGSLPLAVHNVVLTILPGLSNANDRKQQFRLRNRYFRLSCARSRREIHSASKESVFKLFSNLRLAAPARSSNAAYHEPPYPRWARLRPTFVPCLSNQSLAPCNANFSVKSLLLKKGFLMPTYIARYLQAACTCI